MSVSTPTRSAGLLLACLLCAVMLAPASAAAESPVSMALNGGAQFTNSATVTVDSDFPASVRLACGFAPWTSVAAGTFHTVAVRSDGTLWAWGWNAYGQLGTGRCSDPSLPFGSAPDRRG